MQENMTTPEPEKVPEAVSAAAPSSGIETNDIREQVHQQRTTEPHAQQATHIQEGKKNGKGCILFSIAAVAIVFLVGMAGLLFIGAFLVMGLTFSDFTTMPVPSVPETFREQYLTGDTFSSNKVLIIDVRGMIISGASSFSEIANSDIICEQLEQARKDKHVKAIVLRLETPGGEVTASDTIHHKIKEVRGEGKKVVSSMGSLAASGGYYIAAASDYIVANRLTLTGSIGVIIQGYNYRDLLNKIGVYTETYKSGPMKDMLDGSKIRSEQEKIIVQDMVMETYNEFVRIVAEGRRNLSIEKIKTSEIGDGRVFSGQKALELGLVDQLGYYDDAVNKAAEMASIQDSYKVVCYMRKFSFSDLFYEFKGYDKNINVSIPGTRNWVNLVEPGKLYFLPAH